MRRPRDVQAESTTKFFNGVIVVNVSSRVTGVLVPPNTSIVLAIHVAEKIAPVRSRHSP